MLNANTPPFDFLKDQKEPYAGLGSTTVASSLMMDRLHQYMKDAAKRVSDGFGRSILDKNKVASALDSIIHEMWQQNWDPNTGNINLFSTDFGLILTSELINSLNGSIILRSQTDLSHLSIFIDDKCVEIFPFHKILKCLSNKDGEGLKYYVDEIINLCR